MKVPLGRKPVTEKELLVGSRNQFVHERVFIENMLLTGSSWLLSRYNLGSQLEVLLFFFFASNFIIPQTFHPKIGRSYINIYTRLYKYGL